ncbi:MAG TPA: hypothetical protein VNQ32_04005 [Steroidobacteraceae bacterium]|nr:hypothetical protein [Steroidobacteraceae bacterium]
MKRCCHGLSLTELLVATTLLATATAGGVTSLSRAYGARRDAGQQQELHERAQYVFATLEPELQMAGYFGTDGYPAAVSEVVPESALRCGPGVIRRIDLPVQVLAGWPLPCATQGGGQVPGSQVLVLRRAGARLASAPEPGRAQWLTNAGTGIGQLFWQGDAPWNPAAAQGAELRELVLRIYYVARNSDGEAGLPALRVKNLTSIAGAPAFIDTEVMNGVEDLQVELLPATGRPTRVRVQLRVRAREQPVRGAGAPRVLEASRTFALRNAG